MISSEDAEGKIVCSRYMGRFKIVSSTADRWTHYTHATETAAKQQNSVNLCQATEDNFIINASFKVRCIYYEII